MNQEPSIVALITYYKLPKLNEDDQLLAKCLAQHGYDVRIIDWENDEYTWSILDLVILRSVWNYHLKYDKFINWINYLESEGVKIWNNSHVIKWNSNKKYLREISRNFLVIDSLFVSKNQLINDLVKLNDRNWDKIIVKPVISASAFSTIKTTSTQLINDPSLITKCLDHSDILIQPFLEEIETVGEWSMIYYNCQFSHSVLKKPKLGDFRTQSELGGTVIIKRCSENMIKMGNDIISYVSNKFDTPVLYARIDGIDSDGKFTLMEIELIEPFLYFSTNDYSPQNLVNSLINIS